MGKVDGKEISTNSWPKKLNATKPIHAYSSEGGSHDPHPPSVDLCMYCYVLYVLKTRSSSQRSRFLGHVCTSVKASGRLLGCEHNVPFQVQYVVERQFLGEDSSFHIRATFVIGHDARWTSGQSSGYVWWSVHWYPDFAYWPVTD